MYIIHTLKQLLLSDYHDSQRYVARKIVWVIPMVLLASCNPQRVNEEPVRSGADLLGSGNDIRVAESVPGDVILAGSRVIFSGAAGGDYIAAGGDLKVNGNVDGSLRVAGGNIDVGASVGRNVTIAGGEIRLEETAAIGQNAYVAGGEITIRGPIRGNLMVSGGSVHLNGPVDGDVNVNAGSLTIGPNAVIGGALSHRVDEKNLQVDSAATIAGGIIALPSPKWEGPSMVFGFLGVLWKLGFLVAGIAVVLIAPNFSIRTVERLRAHPGRSGLVGVITMIVAPVVGLMVAATVIGLPLFLVAGALYLVTLYLSRVVVALWIGQRLLGERVPRLRRSNILASFLLGGIIIWAIGLIPWIGPLIMLILTVLGFGAILRTLWMGGAIESRDFSEA